MSATDETHTFDHGVTAHGVTVIVTRSAGADNAVVVFVDTNFEPDASDGGPGLRVLINDDPTYEGVPHLEHGGRPMMRQNRRQWRRGRWTVHKSPLVYDLDFPWVVLLWGGSGLHDADGATFATFGEAFDTALEAARNTNNVTPWLEER